MKWLEQVGTCSLFKVHLAGNMRFIDMCLGDKRLIIHDLILMICGILLSSQEHMTSSGLLELRGSNKNHT